MLIGLNWLNSLLSRPVTGEEAERALTALGLPLESRETLAGGEEGMDVEVTSNRGDCLCHVGVAREVAAGTGRELRLPAAKAAKEGGAAAGKATSVENAAPDVCPRFTARVVRGVKVGPSPKWLVERLESVGQRPINNVVDASNYVLLETGNPSHTFDMKKLAGGRLVVRWAREGERLTTLDGKARTLKKDELVVADAEKATSLAGVIGGLDSSVTEATTDLVVEMATWDPATVRRAARRQQVRTDASHRFERIVHAGTIDAAMDRLIGLIVEIAGGEVAPGMIDVGPMAGDRSRERRVVKLRARRCDELLGVEVPPGEIVRLLGSVGVRAEQDGAPGVFRCTIPAERTSDLTREVDLVEEVARLHGYDKIPIAPSLTLTVAAPQKSERAVREAASLLTGLGFYETVTFSFVTKEQAELFIPAGAGMATVSVDEERRKGAPYLRPSPVASLLACRRLNQDAGNKPEGGVRLFEIGPGFAQSAKPPAQTFEHRVVSLVMDAPDRQEGLRRMRGVLETLARVMGGSGASAEVRAGEPCMAAQAAGTVAQVHVRGRQLGGMYLVSDAALKHYGLDEPVVAASIMLDELIELYPPKANVSALPAFPAIERDLSVVVSEATAWAKIAHAVEAVAPARMVGLGFVGTYRGKQVGAGKKSVTLRMRFQDPARTLRHEEVDPQVSAVVDALKREVGAELRG